MIRKVLVVAAILYSATHFAGAWEAASTWDAKSGRYISTEDYKKRYGVTEVCQSASCYDSHSGHFVSGDEWNKREQRRQEDQLDKEKFDRGQ
jgi:hypothetical protein